MSLAKDIIDSVKEKHGVSTETLKKYGYDSVEDVTRPAFRSTEAVDVDYSDEESPSGGLPGMSSGDDTGFPIGGMPPVRFEDVDPPLASSDMPPLMKEFPAVYIPDGTEDGAFSMWRSSKQGLKLVNPQTINLARLHAVIPDRIEAAFRAGFQAGKGSE